MTKRDISLDELRDSHKLLAWIERNKERFPTVNDEMNVFGAAERALEIGSSPVGLFAHITHERRWHLISEAQADRGCRRWKEVRYAGRESGARSASGRADRDGIPNTNGSVTLKEIMAQIIKDRGYG